MNWPLLIILVCAAFADDCSVSIQRKKILKPRVSIDKGADFVSNSFVEAPETCHQGCCDSSLCDTSLYTDHKVDTAGDNCFYFHCHGDCVFSDSQSATNFSVGLTNRTTVQNIPDFQDLFTKKPMAASNDTAIKSVTNPPKVPTVDSKPANTTTSQDSSKPVAPELPATVKPKPVETNPDPEDNQSEPEFEETKHKTEPTAQITPDKTVKDHDELPVKPLKTEPPKQEETEEHVPTEPAKQEPPLVNEVPAVTPDKPEESGDQEQEPDTPPKVEVPVKSDESSVKENVSVEVAINETTTTTTAGYTQRDVVFYIAVIGGAALILLGIGSLVRVYRNKRRSLYSSLADDYLINGMYSI